MTLTDKAFKAGERFAVKTQNASFLIPAQSVALREAKIGVRKQPNLTDAIDWERGFMAGWRSCQQVEPWDLAVEAIKQWRVNPSHYFVDAYVYFRPHPIKPTVIVCGDGETPGDATLLTRINRSWSYEQAERMVADAFRQVPIYAEAPKQLLNE